MKKYLIIVIAALLLFSVSACTKEANKPVPTPTPTPTSTPTPTPTPKAVDYTVFHGNYTDSTDSTAEMGPGYGINISKIDNSTKAIEFVMWYFGYYYSPLYDTETIRATISNDNTVQFEWVDSWQNEGTGTLVLNPDDTSTIKVKVDVTKEAEVNRATLSTHGEYKTLTRT